ncbi:hydroxylamine oxidation protein HaoB [Nitrosovibrio sp. Nv6]|nr:hydroxylamine oxidation protein HaoB [Nitrosovibrio sp. Nv6]
MLLWFAWLWFNPGPAPYRYQLVEEGGIDQFSQLGLEAWPDLTIAQYEVYAEEVDQPLAVTHVARRGNSAPVRLDWENRTSELLLTTDSKLSELTALAGAINKYAAKDALILAWWDTSRQINLLAERDTLFTQRVGEPLIVPAHWRSRIDAIQKYEQEFWDAAASAKEQRRFQRFADALLAEPQAGAAILRELVAEADKTDKGDKTEKAGSDAATPREAYIAIHVTDLYKLGIMRPEQFDMAYKNFPMEGNMHGMIGYLKNWMLENEFKTYTLQSLSDKLVRGYFLRDAKSLNTLIAQMLPFTESQPLDLTAVQLIYQQGGYWVYKIPPAGGDSTQPQPGADDSPPASSESPSPAGG